MQRPELLPRWFKPIAGGPNMFDMREHEWKPWRAVFSRAFSAENILSLVPDMVDETMVYSQTLQEKAKQGKFFHLDPMTLRFMIDVIGKTTLYVTKLIPLTESSLSSTQERTPWGSEGVQRLGRLHAKSDSLASSER